MRSIFSNFLSELFVVSFFLAHGVHSLLGPHHVRQSIYSYDRQNLNFNFNACSGTGTNCKRLNLIMTTATRERLFASLDTATTVATTTATAEADTLLINETYSSSSSSLSSLSTVSSSSSLPTSTQFDTSSSSPGTPSPSFTSSSSASFSPSSLSSPSTSSSSYSPSTLFSISILTGFLIFLCHPTSSAAYATTQNIPQNVLHQIIDVDQNKHKNQNENENKNKNQNQEQNKNSKKILTSYYTKNQIHPNPNNLISGTFSTRNIPSLVVGDASTVLNDFMLNENNAVSVKKDNSKLKLCYAPKTRDFSKIFATDISTIYSTSKVEKIDSNILSDVDKNENNNGKSIIIDDDDDRENVKTVTCNIYIDNFIFGKKWISFSGKYVKISEILCRVIWERSWVDDSRREDGPSSESEIEKHVQPELVQYIGKNFIFPNSEKFPDLYSVYSPCIFR